MPRKIRRKRKAPKAPKKVDTRRYGRPKATRGGRSGRGGRDWRLKLNLSDNARYGIIIVVLILMACFSLLAVFGGGGVLGEAWGRFWIWVFGWTFFMFPLSLIVLAYFYIRREKFKITRRSYLGLVVLLITFAGFFHVFRPLDGAWDLVKAGEGGGFLGYVITFPLKSLAGTAGAFIIILALFLVSLILTFNTSLKAVISKFQVFDHEEKPKLKIKELGEKPKPEFSIRHMLNGENKKTQKQKNIAGRDSEFKHDEDLQINQPEVGNTDGAAQSPSGATLSRGSGGWEPPPLDLLENNTTTPTSGDIKARAAVIKKTLENFGIEVDMAEVNVGPTVTQYTFKPASGIKVSRIVALQNDLALALAAHPIRLEAPIPGKALVGVEVPNEAIAMVKLREILESEDFVKSISSLTLALGRDAAGHPMVADLDKMPHLLIAGATGSGKSVAINALALSLFYRNPPEHLKAILVDPKRVEFTDYNGLPHLLTPVITDPKKTVNALKWSVAEMDRRYNLLSSEGERSITSYNKSRKGGYMPYIVVIIDELADLMSVAAQEVEASIVRLAQMARAVGIHLVVATQRPSVDVLTGLIKANITSRMAFNVASQIDSRTILDMSGAEKLLGNGDMLYRAGDLAKPRRVQGAFVSDKEIRKFTDYLKKGPKPEYQEEILEKPINSVPGVPSSDGEEIDDDMFAEAKEVVLTSGKASASLLQRRLRVGYARAARLLDIMEEKGIVGPADGAKPRDILVKGGSREGLSRDDGFSLSDEDKGKARLDDEEMPSSMDDN